MMEHTHRARAVRSARARDRRSPLVAGPLAVIGGAVVGHAGREGSDTAARWAAPSRASTRRRAPRASRHGRKCRSRWSRLLQRPGPLVGAAPDAPWCRACSRVCVLSGAPPRQAAGSIGRRCCRAVGLDLEVGVRVGEDERERLFCARVHAGAQGRRAAVAVVALLGFQILVGRPATSVPRGRRPGSPLHARLLPAHGLAGVINKTRWQPPVEQC